MGLITPFGVGVDTFWDALMSGRSAVRPAERFDSTGLRTTHWAEMPVVDFDQWFEPQRAAGWAEVTKLAVAGGLMAARDAQLTETAPSRTGVILGTGYGPLYDVRPLLSEYQEGRGRLRPITVPRMMTNAPASHLAIILQARGPTLTVSTACSSGAVALALAVQQVRAGMLDCCLTGGYDLVLNRLTADAWDGLRVLSRRNTSTACRPFSRDRDGIILGEGCGTLVIETREHAERRGARIYAEVRGVGLSNDACDIVRPGFEGAVEVVEAALADAGLDASRIDYVNAHGTGSDANDANELTALERVFGEHARRVPVSSIKGATGHTMGAAGSLEVAATVMAVRTGRVPPTLHLSDPMEGVGLDLVSDRPAERSLTYALSTSSGFGGQNAAIVIGRV